MTKPVITAPVSRFLAVLNAERAIAFYRDVLGFEVRPPLNDSRVPGVAEVVYGPARIQLGTGDSAYDSTGVSRPRGAAMLFFETDNVDAMRQAIRARGGEVSEIEKVNWIKMRMFQIQDPDGHILWFGKSFQEPDQPRPEPMVRQALPELPLANVPAGVAYYRDVLGFKINYAEGNVGVMYRDQITILLIPKTGTHTGIGSFYAYIRDADALHGELVAKGANVQGEPVSHPWGLRDFQVLDLEGNRITFGETFE